MAALDYETSVSILPASIEFGIITNTLVSTSPLTGGVKTLELPGARWKMSMSFEDLEQRYIREVMAFFMSLRGMAGRFQMYDLSHYTPFNGNIGSNISISSVNSRNEIQFNSNLGNTTSTGFKLGDYFSVLYSPEVWDSTTYYAELKMITKVVNVSNRTYQFEPALRGPTSSRYVGRVITTDKPKATFMLSSDEQIYWPSQGKVSTSSLQVEGVEVFT